MPGLIDDSLQAMGDATSSMGVAADAMAQNDVQNLALKQAKRQTQFQYIDALRGLAEQVAGQVAGQAGQDPLSEQTQQHAASTEDKRPGLGDGGDDPLRRSRTEDFGLRNPMFPIPRANADLLNNEVAGGGADVLIGGIGQRMLGGFLNSQSAPLFGSEGQ